MQPIPVIIADDHPVILQGLTDALRGYTDIRVVATIHSFPEVNAYIAQSLEPHGILILDLSGMGDSPVSFVHNFRRKYPHIRVIIFSSNLRLAPVLIDAGVHGYVIKEEMMSVIVQAIRAVARNQSYFSPMVQEYLDSSSVIEQQFNLAPREILVVQYLAQGSTTLDIADQMKIDPRTVQNYITTMLRKLHCTDRVQLVAWYTTIYQTAKHV